MAVAMHEAARTADETAAFDGALAADVEALTEHFNGSHADSVLFIARFAGGALDAVQAEISLADRAGVDLTIRDARDLPAALRIGFPARVDTLDGLRTALLGLLGEARQAAGTDVAPTSIEREIAGRASLPTWLTRVKRTIMVAPHIRQITFSGGLERFQPLGGDQFLYVMVPRKGFESVLDDGFTLAALNTLPEETRPAGAYYTVRAWRPREGELDMWFVLHGHPGAVSGWAAAARTGDRVALWGPRLGFRPPASTSNLLLVGDETALPAIAAILDELHPDQSANVVLETRDERHMIDLRVAPGVRVDWVFRGDQEPGTGSRLLDAVRRIQPAASAGLYAFGAGEAGQIAPIRRYLRRGLGLTSPQVHLTGYWRRSGD